jgi:hypothetical protein
MMPTPSSALVAALLVASGSLASAAPTNYQAPGISQSLSSKSQAYQVGIWSFVLFVVCGILAVRALMTIDYSNDTLLTVDVEPMTGDKDD